MSLPGRRLAATLLLTCWLLAASIHAMAAALPDSTWVALPTLPQQGASAIFGLAVDPSNNQALVAGNAAGTLLRSTNGGAAWTPVYRGKVGYSTITFSPLKSGLVFAGTDGAGALLSRDGGASWQSVSGLEGRTVRAFGFALTLYAAGTDHGVYVSQDGSNWTQAGLATYSIDALAIEAIHAPVRLVAASDSQASQGAIVLFQSLDGGVTWNPFSAPVSGTFTVKLAAGPLPPTRSTRPLLVGTNAGLFESADGVTNFAPLSGGAMLPTTDYTQLAFVTDHFDRFYAASDGGGSGAGGLWRTTDGGVTFVSMNPPDSAVTALAVSNDEAPTLYVATFRPTDHAASIWAFHDTGGTPRGQVGGTPLPASGERTAPPASTASVLDVLKTPQLPYELLGAAAILILLAAGVAHLRGRSR